MSQPGKSHLWIFRLSSQWIVSGGQAASPGPDTRLPQILVKKQTVRSGIKGSKYYFQYICGLLWIICRLHWIPVLTWLLQQLGLEAPRVTVQGLMLLKDHRSLLELF